MKKGMLQILIANIINLVLGLVTGFVLPKYLSVEAYGYMKTYHLYITYIGIFHLGYADGMYLKYGGKNLTEVDRRDLFKSISTLYIFQTIVTFVLLVFSVLIKDWVLIAFALTIFPFNMVGCYKSFYQAVGEFQKYGLLVNLSAIVPVVFIVIFMLLKKHSAIVFVAAYVIAYYIVFVISEVIAKKYCRTSERVWFSAPEFITNIKNGILLMFGNFSSLIMSGMDRWCIKLMMKNMEEFSYYSFAVSMQGMIDVFVSPFTVTMYNFVCKGVSDKELKKLKEYCLVFGLVLIAGAFPVKFIIEVFLQQYLNSCSVIFFLFATELLYLIIKGIYINLYKASGRQGTYFKQLIIVILIALVLNVTFYQINPRRESFAFATLVSTYVWMFLCARQFKELIFSVQDIFIMVSSMILYLFVGMTFSSYVGCGIYAAYVGILLLLFKRKTVKALLKLFFQRKAV